MLIKTELAKCLSTMKNAIFGAILLQTVAKPAQLNISYYKQLLNEVE